MTPGAWTFDEPYALSNFGHSFIFDRPLGRNVRPLVNETAGGRSGSWASRPQPARRG